MEEKKDDYPEEVNKRLNNEKSLLCSGYVRTHISENIFINRFVSLVALFFEPNKMECFVKLILQNGHKKYEKHILPPRYPIFYKMTKTYIANKILKIFEKSNKSKVLPQLVILKKSSRCFITQQIKEKGKHRYFRFFIVPNESRITYFCEDAGTKERLSFCCLLVGNLGKFQIFSENNFKISTLHEDEFGAIVDAHHLSSSAISRKLSCAYDLQNALSFFETVGGKGKGNSEKIDLTEYISQTNN